MAENNIQTVPFYLDESNGTEERIEDLMKRMTVEEKVALCHAQSKFSSPGVARLGVPGIIMSDGPHGIREELLYDLWEPAGWTNDSCFAFPALTCLAATWNPGLSYLYGKSIGEEALYRRKDVLLGPGVNIYRTPLNGRNFEYMGEDPHLASVMVVPYIKGVQGNGVAACVKHFAVNNQETNRHKVDVKVSDRALYELYLPAFKAAVEKGGVWALMGAYNKYNGEHCCHNDRLLNKILKGDWNFDGVVVSDWGGTHDTPEAVRNGLDMEFGTWTDGLNWGESDSYSRYHLADPYLEKLKSGEFTEKELNDKVRRILRLIFRTSMGKHPGFGSFVSEQHMNAGKEIAEEGIVLLKNRNNILPINLESTKRIAVIGENAVRPLSYGGGSSALKVKYEITPLQGIRNLVEDKAEILFARGYVSDSQMKSGEVGRSREDLLAEAVDAARKADVVIFVGGLNKDEHQDCEGSDRESMDLPYGQNELIGKLAEANPNLIVDIISGNAVSMPWVDKAAGILASWFCGSESGNAVANVLFGKVNPSGKLPFTFPVRLSDCGAHAIGAFPGTAESVEYKEDIFVGYRWHDKKRIKPLFAFGHGLSYTDFEYGKPKLSAEKMGKDESLVLKVKVTNTGKQRGKEVVQLYIKDKQSGLPRPEKELKGFEKVSLEPGESKEVTFLIDKEMLSYYDDRQNGWVAEPGAFVAMIGSASDDIRRSVEFSLK